MRAPLVDVLVGPASPAPQCDLQVDRRDVGDAAIGVPAPGSGQRICG